MTLCEITDRILTEFVGSVLELCLVIFLVLTITEYCEHLLMFMVLCVHLRVEK